MPRVLVIDDQSGVRTMISLVLRINQFEIVEAATAAAALKSFEEGRFDLAIVDIFLQGANGSDLIATMRQRVPDLPVIAISGMTARSSVRTQSAVRWQRQVIGIGSQLVQIAHSIIVGHPGIAPHGELAE